jgi:elongator complex protein 4
MSFRKRNVGLSSSPRTTQSPLQNSNTSPTPKPPPRGVRPSPVDGRPTTSTGTHSLDALLAGHTGLALGTSLLIEESGTTDFGGALLRYYAAEGIVQGHRVHVVGVGEGWGRELPGLAGAVEGEELEGLGKGKRSERMKIAWRYERLGEFGGVAGSRGGPPPCDDFVNSHNCRIHPIFFFGSPDG